MRLVITRPRADGETTAKKLEKLGHEALISPVMEVVCLPDAPLPDINTLNGLVITSRNALRCLAKKAHIGPSSPSIWHSLPLFAVGKATGQEARQLGFMSIIYGNGHASSLPDFIKQFQPHLDPQNGKSLYYPVGAKKAFDLAPALRQQGILLTEQIVYESLPSNRLAPIVRKGLLGGTVDGVLLMSPRTARLFCAILKNNKLQQHVSAISALCLSQNVAEAASTLPWRQTLIAPHPDMDHLLGLIEQIDTK